MNEEQQINACERDLADPHGAFGALWHQWRQRLLHSNGSVDVSDFGRRAWRDCTEYERTVALNGLFTAYAMRILDEERQQRLAAAAKDDITYLEKDDVFWVQQAFSPEVDITSEFAIAEGVLAAPLDRVLRELELLQFRLAMKDEPSTTDG